MWVSGCLMPLKAAAAQTESASREDTRSQASSASLLAPEWVQCELHAKTMRQAIWLELEAGAAPAVAPYACCLLVCCSVLPSPELAALQGPCPDVCFAADSSGRNAKGRGVKALVCSPDVESAKHLLADFLFLVGN